MKLNHRRKHRVRSNGTACADARWYGHTSRCPKGKCTWCESNRTAKARRNAPQRSDWA